MENMYSDNTKVYPIRSMLLFCIFARQMLSINQALSIYLSPCMKCVFGLKMPFIALECSLSAIIFILRTTIGQD